MHARGAARRWWRAPIALCLAFGASFLLPAAPALAGTLNVTLAGAGAGSVKSDPAAISCSNAANPGGPGSGECSKDFGFVATALKLTAEPAGPAYVFAGWSGSGAGACNTGLAGQCQFTLAAIGAAGVTATFIPKPPPPLADTDGSAPGPTGYLAMLEGKVNPNGSGVLDCRFEYGPTAAYGNSVPCTPKASELGSGSAPVAVSAETEPLDPAATYHFRLVASNLGGSAAGKDLSFATGPAGPDNCPNADRRAEQGIAALLLPDCMALEMVSPPQKSGQTAKYPSLSTDGERVLFVSTAPLGGTPGVLLATGDPYVASRTAAGWETAPTVPPGQFPRGWGIYPQAQSFSPDLSRWFQIASTFSQFQVGAARVFGGGLGGLFEPLSPPLALPKGLVAPQALTNLKFEAASADHSHLYFAPGERAAAYLPGPVPAGAAADKNVYVAAPDSSGTPSLQLLARDSGGEVWGERCGVRMGGNRQVNNEITRNQGAVSADGSLAYFSTRPGQSPDGFCTEANKLRILVRTESTSGPEIEPLIEEPSGECDREPVCSTAAGDDRYQGASVDGSKVYLTTTRQLADSDIDATNDLYLYDRDELAGQHLTQVSAGGTGDATPGAGANVEGNVAALSTDGSHVYFVSTDVLTTDANPPGATAAPGQLNLYLWQAATGETAFIGVLAAADAAALWRNQGGFQNQAYPVPTTGQNSQGEEVGGDGHILLLQSKAPLTADDSDGGRLDAFRHDSLAGTLECVSCKPGGPDAGPFDLYSRWGETSLALGTDFAERGRWVSEDGDTVAFATAQPLLPGDPNGVADFFLWRDGALHRLPGPAFLVGESASMPVPTLSHDGDEVAFQTGTALLPSDGDSAADVYVARVGGGYAFPPPPLHCTGEGCQEPFTPQPGGPAMGVPRPSAPALVCPRNSVRRNGKCACKQGFARKNRSCVKKPRKQRRAHRKHRKAKTNSDRRAVK
jgi:hypothetical protein